MSRSILLQREVSAILTKISPRLLRNPLHLLSLGFGSGLSPFAPGTCGTLAAIPLYLLLAQLPFWYYLAAVAVAFAIGVYLCGYTSNALGEHDHGGIVWDEFVGFWITMIAVPVTWQWVLAGFVLFRLFDIAKPWPVRVAGPVIWEPSPTAETTITISVMNSASP